MIREQKNDFNIWNYKPWWCQPWSIILTGIVIISSSWFLLKTLWITLPIAILIFIWWGYFLIIYPQLLKKVLGTDSLTVKSETKKDYSK
jgi:hypothetical protein